MFEEWLNNIKEKYTVNISVKDGGNYFTSKIYEFIDPSGKGLSFTISVDDDSLPSVFDSPTFPFEQFNKAENASPEDILKAADKCLAGDLSFKKTLLGGKYKLAFDLPTFKGYSVAVKYSVPGVPEYSAYQKWA